MSLALVAQQAPADPALARLEKSPRHHEWIDVKHGERTVRCFAAFPEVKQNVHAVIVIHENRGLNDWARSVADQLAEAGYVAIAPDLLSGKGQSGGDTQSFASGDDARKAIYALDADAVAADLGAVADHALKLAACDGTVSVAGFCWGGAKSFDFATRRKGLKAAYVFYGGAPADAAALARIECPVFGFYGENDARITDAVPATAEAMKKASKTFEPAIYAGAGHGFLRAGEASDASDANKQAYADAWTRWKRLLASGK
ncbi:MAG: dienelactone hydrolase family protein [Planctomycetota bacterium]